MTIADSRCPSRARSKPAQAYGYNADGQVSSRTDATGTATFSYAAPRRAATMTDPVTGATLAYSYDAANELTSVSFGSGADSRTLGYDPLGRVTSDALKTSAAPP